MWFKRGGAPPHFLSTVRPQWNWTFGGQWVGCGGPLNWPAGSPSGYLAVVTPKDFGVCNAD